MFTARGESTPPARRCADRGGLLGWRAHGVFSLDLGPPLNRLGGISLTRRAVPRRPFRSRQKCRGDAIERDEEIGAFGSKAGFQRRFPLRSPATGHFAGGDPVWLRSTSRADRPPRRRRSRSPSRSSAPSRIGMNSPAGSRPSKRFRFARGSAVSSPMLSSRTATSSRLATFFISSTPARSRRSPSRRTASFRTRAPRWNSPSASSIAA